MTDTLYPIHGKETVMADTERPRRGRPRPDDSIKRDKRIRALLDSQGPMTRNDIADTLAISRSLAYLALDRLRADKLVKRCLRADGTSVWTTKVTEPCP